MDRSSSPSSGVSARSSRYGSISSSSSSAVFNPPPVSPAGAATLLPSRSPPAPRGSRSPRPGPACARAAPVCSRAGRAALLRSSAAPRRSCRSLLHDPPQYPVHEPSRVLRGVALRERDRLVDRHLDGDLAAVELQDREPQDVALERTEAVGGPLVRGFCDAAGRILVPLYDGLGEPAP